MKRRLFKIIALAICFCSTVGALVGKTLDNEQKWFRVSDTTLSTPYETAPCSGSPAIACATLWERANASSPWTQVTVGGSPVTAYGNFTN
ncbi:hypothetical protein SAMN05216436_11213 [bacterium A37T11]|nr:hypothetical protein SAMN05216436_11213 [bacterium A37T11]